jgi:hypothetical protein
MPAAAAPSSSTLRDESTVSTSMTSNSSTRVSMSVTNVEAVNASRTAVLFRSSVMVSHLS